MIIIVDGINKKEVLEKAIELKEELSIRETIDGKFLKFLDYVKLLKSNEDLIIYNSFIENQAESIVDLTIPDISNEELITLSFLMTGKTIVYYMIDNDWKAMYDRNDSYEDEEEFKKVLKAYNITANACKTLFPIISCSMKQS